MKLTNKFNIPQTFINVLDRPTYSKGKANLSVTQLINSPKIVALTKKFEDELEQDVSDMVWSIFGSAVHKVLEHGQDANHIVEERLSTEIDGWKISGAIDLQIKGDNFIEIRDYKTVSAWAVMNEKIEWEYQLNLYAYLVERAKNVPVASLGIVAIIRDWSRREAAKNPDYPQAPIKEIPIPLWPFSSREVFIKARVHAHAACEFELETDGNLPFCTSQEMWEKPTVWAVKKLGGARAKSVHFTHQEALEALAKAGRDYEIEVRPGSRTRCESFCPVSNYCQQWRDYQEGK
jgi:hypothetical protein